MPETTTDAAATKLAQSVADATGRQVFVVTHNTQFVQARRLSQEETAAIMQAEADG